VAGVVLVAVGVACASATTWLSASSRPVVDAAALSGRLVHQLADEGGAPLTGSARTTLESEVDLAVTAELDRATASSDGAVTRSTIGIWAVVGGGIALLGAFGVRLRRQTLALERATTSRDADQRLRRLIAASPEFVVVVRLEDGAITYLSPAATHALEHHDGPLTGDALLALVADDDRHVVSDRLRSVTTQGGSTRFECRLETPAGMLHLDCTVSNHHDDPELRGLVVNAVDITERAELTKDLSHQARHDALTGLLNRTAFIEAVDRSLLAGVPMAILLVDLDGFKEVNDTLGHAAGDRVLTTAAARFATLVRQNDLVARLGGDEFAIMLAQPDNGGAETVARRLLDTMAAPIEAGEATEVLLTGSVGIAMSMPGLDASTLLKRADAAMYEAKELGRARFAVYVPELEARFAHRLELRAAIERGLANREFLLQYQPIHAVGTNHLVGFESLLRWQRPDGTFMNPGDFLPIAEASGQIVPLGRWVLHAAMRQLGIWRQLDPKLGMAINVSPRQLGEPGFVREVALLLDTHGLDPAAVSFEVTETMLVDDPERTAARLRDLKALGVRLAIDDYGAGNAAIGFLLSFPIDTVKFDRNLVASLDTEPVKTEALIRSITTLAHTLDLETVAEGVERPEQLAQITALGCSKAQGFFLSRPMFHDRAERYLLAHSGLPTR